MSNKRGRNKHDERTQKRTKFNSELNEHLERGYKNMWNDDAKIKLAIYLLKELKNDKHIKTKIEINNGVVDIIRLSKIGFLKVIDNDIEGNDNKQKYQSKGILCGLKNCNNIYSAGAYICYTCNELICENHLNYCNNCEEVICSDCVCYCHLCTKIECVDCMEECLKCSEMEDRNICNECMVIDSETLSITCPKHNTGE